MLPLAHTGLTTPAVAGPGCNEGLGLAPRTASGCPERRLDAMLGQSFTALTSEGAATKPGVRLRRRCEDARLGEAMNVLPAAMT